MLICFRQASKLAPAIHCLANKSGRTNKLPPGIHCRYLANRFGSANKLPQGLEGLNFHLSEQEAAKKLMDSQALFEQSISNKDVNLEPIKSLTLTSQNRIEWKSCFVPFHTIDIQHLQSGFIAEYGIDRIEIDWVWVSTEKGGRFPMPVPRTVTDWHHTQGIAPRTSYPFGETLQTQVYAGFDYPREPLEQALVMQEVANISTFQCKEEHTTVLPFQMKVKMALSIMLQKLHELESERVCEYLKRHHRAQHARIRSLDVHLDQASVQWISYYVPCFIYSYTVGEMKLYKFLNGYTGESGGERIYSPWKVGALGAVIAAGLTSYVTRTLALRVLLPGTLIPSVLVAGATYLYSKFRYYNNRKKLQQQQTDNKNKFQQCDLDAALASNSTNANGSSSQTENTEQVYRVHEQLARLLGLSSTSPVTMQQIKQAYHKQLQKYHPDVYRGNNKEFAELMTQQLNTEYEKFTKQRKTI